MNIIEVIKDVTTIGALASIIGIFYYTFCGFGRSLVNIYESSGLSNTKHFDSGITKNFIFPMRVIGYGGHLLILLYFSKYLLKHEGYSDIDMNYIFETFSKKQIAQTKYLFFYYFLFIFSNLSVAIFFD